MSATAEKFIEWVDALPPTWGASRLGSIATVKARLGWKGLKAEEYVDAGYIFLSTPNLKGDDIDFENVNYITKARYDESPEIMLRVGDVLMVKDGATLGIVALVKSLPAPATLNGSTAVIRPIGKCDSRFLCYWLRSRGIQQLIEKMKGGMGVPHLFQSDLRRFPVAIPPPTAQRRIAAYLDEATGKVDRLVALRRRQMELLREQRAALIQQAVTRGLNPRAPLKNSGLPWLGRIPKHWEVKPLGSFATVKARLGWRGLKAEEYVEQGYIFLATPNIKGEDIDFQNVNYITRERYDESPEIMLKEGDVLVVKDGATLGITALVKTLPAPATVNGSIAVIRASRKCSGEFLACWFHSHGVQQLIDMMKGGMGVPHLFQSDLRKFLVALPPSDEQREILAHIQRETAKLDGLHRSYTRQLALLAEYRAALIHECVTGQRCV